MISQGDFGGDIDFDFSKRRNCSLHNRSTVHMIKRNRTMHSIKSKSSVEMGKLFLIAREYSKTLRQKYMNQEDLIKIVAKKKRGKKRFKQIWIS